ncbi:MULTISPECIES: CvpA family protein [unclassified Campylobacter]|uniref:CvpA family protein n=1 Tax=unclassified Campylobacter TaxID=2593542 RepID=UPI001BD9A993|nr:MULTISPECIES: CvpA family protein [unclassified Campylobacter]MBZ7975753.1 CvpA family protein [Campylobacter sp. RM12637]MBZ7977984.1 CvpA family protein [Campylobacter sp. RM12654]MBZ7979704.1 CvpA family protein [Campylobacter sp. RM12642]MBZ7981504.1 CvpA family protein [Campylobacter sp. RM12640]MBZ7983578.1 CvpA family protein [Campylobacter sp. RM12647]MBZ7989071.1 CvpA family protein [Campylobacter sp. RM12635]MBZ7990634.1 CvpA family protein [Campylobacter sp. RM9331]MBZ7992342.
MNSGLILDCVIIGVTLILGIGGIISGLIKEGFGLAGILVGVYVSTSNSEKVGALINQYVYKSDNELLLNLCGFVITLVIVWGIFLILGRIISKLVALSGLGIIDKIMGFIFCAGKIFIIFSIIASCINALPIINSKVNQFFANSMMYPVLIQTGGAIANIQAIQNTINTKKENLLNNELKEENSK